LLQLTAAEVLSGSTEWFHYLMLGAEQCRAVKKTSQSKPEQVKVDVSIKVCPKTRKVSELLSCVITICYESSVSCSLKILSPVKLDFLGNNL
jgi:hypothetical protein